MQPDVTVILPSLNVAEYMEECLESVVNQTLQNIEIICIDAGSVDGTVEIIKKYVAMDKRVRLIYSDVKSYGYQVNIGIQESQGVYIAVLETDDYIDLDMYRILYELAITYKLDYVKADHDQFIELNGKRVFTTIQTLINKEYYNKVISSNMLPEVYLTDQNVWKGIYSREFLDRHNIRFNESQGAAYQDIGFQIQTLYYAARAMYIPNSFYRYRVDRDGASSCNKNVLKYAYQEFSRLKDNELIPYNDTMWKYIYQRMASVLVDEYKKLIRKEAYDIESKHISGYYGWFKEQLSEALIQHPDVLDGLDRNIQLRAKLLIYSPQSFADYCYTENLMMDDKRARLFNHIKGRHVVIVGCGVWGKRIAQVLLEKAVVIDSFADNSTELCGESYAGIMIRTPEECERMYSDDCYVIANKKYSRVLKEQLNNMGILDDSICIIEELL